MGLVAGYSQKQRRLDVAKWREILETFQGSDIRNGDTGVPLLAASSTHWRLG